MNEAREERVKKSVLNLYAMLGVSCILSIIPSAAAAFLSLIFFAAVLIWAYSVRSSSEPHSFGKIHAEYLIRTIWVSGLFALITTAIAGAYLVSGLDHTPFEACSNDLATKGTAWIESAGYEQVYAIIQPCVNGFIAINKTMLINAVIIAGGPVLIYMGFRFYKGLSKALKGYILPENKSWF